MEFCYLLHGYLERSKEQNNKDAIDQMDVLRVEVKECLCEKQNEIRLTCCKWKSYSYFE